MATIDVTAEVTRHELGLAPLALNTANDPYEIVQGFSPGGVSQRRIEVESPIVDSTFVVHSVKDRPEMEFGLYVVGDTYDQAVANADTLIEAFTGQVTYNLTVVIEGRTHEWRCQTADYELALRTAFVATQRLAVRFAVPRHPVPVQGVL